MADAHSEVIDVFLSYCSADERVVESLAHKLREIPLSVFLDRWSLIPGESSQRGLADGLLRSKACAVFIGPNGFGPWHEQEIEVAVERRVMAARSSERYRVIPVLLPGTKMPPLSQRPPFLTTATWVELESLQDEEGLRRLVAGVRGVPPGPGRLKSLPEGVDPYLGLSSFGSKDAPLFFGRDAVADEMLRKLRRDPKLVDGGPRFLAVVGASGSGKSSVLDAGLVPRVERGRLPGSDGWPIVRLRPGARPLESLSLAMRGHAQLGGRGSAALALEAELSAGRCATRHRLEVMREGDKPVSSLESDENAPEHEGSGGRALHRYAETVLGEDRAGRLLVVVDQFEEVFALCEDEAARQVFFDNLMTACTEIGGRTIVVVGMRADFVARCTDYPRLLDALSENTQFLGAMRPEELRDAIEQPALLAGGQIESGLTERLIDAVRANSGALPLLQHVLRVLWDKRTLESRLTRAVYEDAGELRGALAQHAESVFSDHLTAEEQALAPVLFGRLIRPGEGTQDTKRRISLSELPSSETMRSLVRKISDEEARLVVVDGDEADQHLELSHEALIGHWPKLSRWIDEDRDAIRTQQRVSEAAKEWSKYEKDPSYLLVGSRLAAAEDWLGARPEASSDLERRFVEASVSAQDAAARAARERDALERRRLRNRAYALGALSLGLSLAAGVAGRATIQAQRLDVRGDIRASVISSARQESEPKQILTLLEAYLRAQEVGGEFPWVFRTSLGELDRIDGPQYLLGPQRQVLTAQLSGNGDKLVAATAAGRLWIWDLRHPSALPRTIDRPRCSFEQISFDRFSIDPSGRFLVLYCTHLGLTVVDLEHPTRRLKELKTGPKAVTIMAFAPSGERLLMGTLDTMQVLSISPEGQVKSEFEFENIHDVKFAAWSPQGKELLVFSDGGMRLWTLTATSANSVELAEVDSWDSVRCLAFSASGDHVLIKTHVKPPEIWSLRPRPKKLRSFMGSRGRVARCGLAAGGRSGLLVEDDGIVLEISLDSSTSEVQVRAGDAILHTTIVSTAGDRVLVLGENETPGNWHSELKPQLTRWAHTYPGVFATAYTDRRNVNEIHSEEGSHIRMWSSLQPTGGLLEHHEAPVTHGAFSPDGDRLVTTSEDNTAVVWDLRASPPAVVRVLRHGSRLTRVHFDPTGDLLITEALWDKRSWLWDWNSLAEAPRLVKGTRIVFEPKGQKFLSLLNSSVGLWANRGPTVEPTLLRVFEGTSRFQSATFDATGTRAVTTADGEAKVWDLLDGNVEPRTLHGLEGTVWSAAFTRDGRRLVVGATRPPMSIWDLTQPNALPVMFKRHALRSYSYTLVGPRERYLASVGDDEQILVRRLDELEAEPRRLRNTRLVKPSFSPDGKLLAAVSTEGQARIWNLEHSNLVRWNIPPHSGTTNAVTSVVFSPDGNRLLTTSKDNSARIWELDPDSLVRRTCNRIRLGASPGANFPLLSASYDAHKTGSACELVEAPLPR